MESLLEPDIELVSADSHVLEPMHIWNEWLPTRYRASAPMLMDDGAGGHAWRYAGTREAEPIALTAQPGQDYSNLRVRGVDYAAARPGTFDGAARIDDQDCDGVSAEIILPTPRPMSHFLDNPDQRIVLAGVEAWNRFVLEEFCSRSPRRLFPIAQLPTTGVEDMNRVLEWAAARDFVGVVLPCWPSGGDHLGTADSSFWSRAEEIGLPVCIHATLRSREERLLLRELSTVEDGGMNERDWALLGERDTAPEPLEYHTRIGNPGIGLGRAASTLSVLLLSGIFDRYPRLKIALLETWVGWIPRMLEAVDDVWRRNRYRMRIGLEHPPSSYWYQNMAASFLDDKSGVLLRDQVGVRNMMWSSDYPHFVTHWPNSRSVAARSMQNVPTDELRMILAHNCRRFFNLGESG